MDLTELTTYQALVYRSRANRTVKTQVEKVLHEYNLTMAQWAVLGFIKDAGKRGIRISDLAAHIDTSLAFITNSVNTLEKKGIVYRTGHERDNRAKLVYIANDYRHKVASIEQRLRRQLCDWYGKVLTQAELETQLEVFRKLAQTNE